MVCTFFCEVSSSIAVSADDKTQPRLLSLDVLCLLQLCRTYDITLPFSESIIGLGQSMILALC